MHNLVKIQEKDGQQLVSARDLYSFLEATERFNSWAERNLKYGFLEGRDYSPLTSLHTQNKVEIQDFVLTIDTAKQIAMMSRSDKGLQIREYFIECEKKLKEVSTTLPDLSTHIGSVEAYLNQLKATAVLQEAKKIAELEAATQKALVQELAPAASYTKVVLTSVSTFRTTQIAVELNMSAIKLNQVLEAKKVQHKVNGEWCLNAKYQGKGYTESSTHVYKNSVSETCTSISTVWTEKGRLFIHELLNPNLNNSLKPLDN